LALSIFMLTALSSIPLANPEIESEVSPALATEVEGVKQECQITVESYPQSLPNDGYSEAVLKVALMIGDLPVCGETVFAQVTRGDIGLDYEEAVTDEDGLAEFSLQAGLIPEPAEISVSTENTATTASLSIPLAPVTYLDILLVTPEDYENHLERQASAAPIYTLGVSAFPGQLAADGGSMAMINACLRLTDGTPAPGVPLVAEIISGEGTLAYDEIATDKAGMFQFYFIAGILPGTVTISLTEPSTGLVSVVDIMLVEAGPARVELLYYDPLSPQPERDGAILPADGISSLPVIARVTDLTGLPLPGVELRIEIIEEETGWLEILDPQTDAAGEVEFSYYSGTTTGPVRIRAFVAAGV